MSRLDFGWESLLRTDAPAGSRLKAALFTTYDRPDDRLLAEHLLPLLLNLGREPDGEGSERQYFLLELDERLKQLHDRLVVISSAVREEPTADEADESGAYSWIWRSIRHLTVGKNRSAVQHAKLWLLHWSAPNAEGAEHLELVVSSANLTRAAFKSQLQAAWRVCLELRPQGSAARLAAWGILPQFLNELAASTGAKDRLNNFVDLLKRAECPPGVQWVGGVPGVHPRKSLRQSPWGSAGLARVQPPGRGDVSVSILSPFVGAWDKIKLTRWGGSFGSSPEKTALVWIDKNHPWAQNGNWILPQIAAQTLTAAGARLLHLSGAPDGADAADRFRFHDEHQPRDDRWSHAKLYLFKRGPSRRLLVTSANFSPAAWGTENAAGDLRIENFELGVCLEQSTWGFDQLDAFENSADAATVAELARLGVHPISWAQADWDGNVVSVECRCDTDRVLDGRILHEHGSARISRWRTSPAGLRTARVAWKNTSRVPATVRLKCGEGLMHVPVFDARPPLVRDFGTPPEVDVDLAQTRRDELLFEHYGGQIAGDAEGIAAATNSNDAVEIADNSTGQVWAESYAVPAFDSARAHLAIVDRWVERLNSADDRDLLLRDGKMLLAAFERQTERDAKKGIGWSIGAQLAAEELKLRLNHPVE